MPIQIFETYEALSQRVADEIIRRLQEKPASVLCLAAGDTPRRAYQLLSERAAKEALDFSRCSFIGLDEWVGIPPENEGSCSYFLHQNLFQPLGIDAAQVNLFDGLARDSDAECRRMNSVVKEKGGIDLMLVGVGMNGHIGFNEPGVGEGLYAHVINLDETTRSVGQKYFLQTTKLARGITLGLRHVLESRQLIMMASGRKKADVMRKALEDPISMEVPASIIRKHPRAVTMLDKEAASLLRQGKSA
ncbi:MAG TPA: glucosamine-6-phosphate deaminase [Cyclobacteriaceae bacterium]|nr:glucosamine-6-phosphate deaminase [Cyclobacteriaceae bacterium]